MTTEKTKIEPTKITKEATETKPIQHTDGAQYHCVVMVNGELFMEKTVPLLHRAATMKTVRAGLRSRGLTITKAVVVDDIETDLVTKTITFEGVEITAKPIRTSPRPTKDTGKDYTASNEVILGILHDDDISPEDKEATLSKHDRHELIAAAKANGDTELKGRATKKAALASLLARGES